MNVHPDIQFSTIAELLFLQSPNLNFARLVADLDAVLARFHDKDRQLTWDCEDLATFDMPGTRIVLATADAPRPGVAASLTLSVGPSHLPARPRHSGRRPPAVRHEALCSRLVERVQARLNPDAVFWHEWALPVTAEVIDSLACAKPKSCQRADPQHPMFTDLNAQNVDAIYARGFQPSNDNPDIPSPHDPELSRLRAALYPHEAEAPPHLVSPQMRLAAHTMNATLIMVALPVGAAMLTYSVLRGENMRLTSAALVATGFAATVLQGPMASALIG